MSRARVKLYNIPEMNIERNYIIDDFTQFLNQHEDYNDELVTYHKHALNTFVKLKLPQKRLNFFDAYVNYTYMEIQNIDENGDPLDTYPVYYYITEKKWRSQECIEFTIQMDVLNTFTEERGNFTFSNKTLVIREMRDRFSRYSGSTFRRIVDEIDEGLTPQLYREGHTPLEDTLEVDGNDWYLVYRNLPDLVDVNGTMPIECGVYSSKESSYNLRYPVELFPEGSTHYYFIDDIYDFIIYSDSQPFEKWTTGVRDGFTHYDVIAVTASSIKAFNYRSGQVDLMNKVRNYSFTEYRYSLHGDTDSPVYYEYGSETLRKSDFILNPITIGYNSASIPSIDLVDRSDTYISKIIRYPYCPISFGEGNAKWLPVEWDVRYIDPYHELYGKAIVSTIFTEFGNTFTFQNYSPLSPLRIRIDEFGNAGVPVNRDYESKLYNSAFYLPKVSFDTFSKSFELERMNDTQVTSDTTSKFVVEFKPTNTMNSKMAFIFPQYKCTNKAPEDFYNILIIARNNEETIFNSAYLDYMRVGYGYDEQSRILGLVNSGFGIFNGVLGSSGGDAMMKAGAGTWNLYNQFAQGEISKERALANLRAQGVSVSGAESPDILKHIAGNRLIKSIYKIKKEDESYIFNLFYHNGYLTNMVKQPNHNTRMYFDFLQALLDTSALYNIPEDCRSALKAKFAEGVTYFHNVNGTYDIEQTFENWETNV